MPRRLRLAFEEPATFRAEFERNIANGGAFLDADEPCELREIVEVELALAFCGETLSLEAEVVHVVPAGRRYGLAVQFLQPASELRERLRPLLAGAGAPAGPAPASAASGEEAWDIDLDAETRSPEAAEAPASPAAPAATAPRRRSAVPGRERRRAPRAAARVPARLEASHVALDGRTRDLSENGVLISADASELPIGKRVALSLRHPDTGERVQVSGRVSRHVEGEGAVAAVAVTFDGPPDDPALTAFVAAVRQSEAQRRREGIRGRIEELGMPSLLQMLAQSSRQGTLTLTCGSEEGVIAFDAGLLRYARLGAARGRKAFTRLLAWSRGAFVFHAGVDRLEDEDDPVPLEALLLDGARALDEAARPGAPSLDPRERFRLDREALAACGSLSKTEEAVVELAAAEFSVRRILDVIPEDDGEIRDALLSLRERGVLVPASAAPPGARTPGAA